ncbi:MAG: pyridoxal phosphate enzyme (YggS family) [Saprospiraceae bacterium]|jgi:pyridoxal phosphate enzyme (YggS family)
MSISTQLHQIKHALPSSVNLVAVSKTKPNEMLLEAYEAGQRIFGENKVQELARKHEDLPKDIEWHMIGHLQSNKVKYIAPFVSLIHAVDSTKLLKEINKQGKKNDRIINVLLQVHIAQEETKFGFDAREIKQMISSSEFAEYNNIQIKGVMGMATNTTDQSQIATEFGNLKSLFDELKSIVFSETAFTEISMGMSGDYKIAVEQGSTMVRVGSAIFGSRN